MRPVSDNATITFLVWYDEKTPDVVIEMVLIMLDHKADTKLERYAGKRIPCLQRDGFALENAEERREY